MVGAGFAGLTDAEADEIFATGNYGKVQPCTRFEDNQMQPGPVAAQARKLYFDWAEGSRILPGKAA